MNDNFEEPIGMTSLPSTQYTLRARWIFPVSSAPIADGKVTIFDGKIVQITQAELGSVDCDLGNTALLPGLVNAHTHLDLSGLRGKLSPQSVPFVDWLQGIIRFRLAQSPEEIRQAISAGIQEAMSFGTTLIGDIASGGLSLNQLSESSIWSVVYRELIGLPQANAHQSWSQTIGWLFAHSGNNRCRLGLSPHAPYSVRKSLFRAVAAIAADRNLPTAIHLGESPDEVELIDSRTGRMVDFLQRVNAYDPGGLVESLQDVMNLTAKVPGVQFTHGNQMTSATAKFEGTGHGWVVCPRTRDAFGFTGGPIDLMATNPLLYEQTSIGTDSLASNPDLDPLAEIRFLHRKKPEIPEEVLLKMVTLNGAKALKADSWTGSIEVGKSADLLALSLSDSTPPNPHDLLFEEVPNQKRRTMWRGGWRE